MQTRHCTSLPWSSRYAHRRAEKGERALDVGQTLNRLRPALADAPRRR